MFNENIACPGSGRWTKYPNRIVREVFIDLTPSRVRVCHQARLTGRAGNLSCQRQIEIVARKSKYFRSLRIREGYTVVTDLDLYYIMNAMCTELGSKGVLQPVVSAWLPVLFFAGIGAVMFDNLRT